MNRAGQNDGCSGSGMPIPWGEHLELARCVEATGELHIGAAAVAMAGALHHLQRDLLVASWKESTPQCSPQPCLLQAETQSLQGIYPS